MRLLSLTKKRSLYTLITFTSGRGPSANEKKKEEEILIENQ